MEEEKKYRVASCNRRLSRDLLFVMAGTPGITIYNREESQDYRSRIIYTAEDESALVLLKMYVENSFYLCGNVQFED